MQWRPGRTRSPPHEAFSLVDKDGQDLSTQKGIEGNIKKKHSRHGNGGSTVSKFREAPEEVALNRGPYSKNDTDPRGPWGPTF